jgi:hypothetical protein
MERCAGCGRELDAGWKYCIYCGRPLAALRREGDGRNIPAAIRPGSHTAPDVPGPKSRYDAPFWVGVGMGVLGLALIVYAAIQIYSTYG